MSMLADAVATATDSCCPVHHQWRMIRSHLTEFGTAVDEVEHHTLDIPAFELKFVQNNMQRVQVAGCYTPDISQRAVKELGYLGQLSQLEKLRSLDMVFVGFQHTKQET